jgi:hypothetical protein
MAAKDAARSRVVLASDPIVVSIKTRWIVPRPTVLLEVPLRGLLSRKVRTIAVVESRCRDCRNREHEDDNQ